MLKTTSHKHSSQLPLKSNSLPVYNIQRAEADRSSTIVLIRSSQRRELFDFEVFRHQTPSQSVTERVWYQPRSSVPIGLRLGWPRYLAYLQVLPVDYMKALAYLHLDSRTAA